MYSTRPIIESLREAVSRILRGEDARQVGAELLGLDEAGSAVRRAARKTGAAARGALFGGVAGFAMRPGVAVATAAAGHLTGKLVGAQVGRREIASHEAGGKTLSAEQKAEIMVRNQRRGARAGRRLGLAGALARPALHGARTAMRTAQLHDRIGRVH